MAGKLGVGSVVGERYRLERRVARGGMGSLWSATHLALNSPVAVKLMHASFAENSDARARFEREARAGAKIRSAYVAQIYDYGVEGETPFIVMELLEGEDLSTRLKREKTLSPEAAIQLATQVAKGLAKPHQLGIVHRDLKPGNLFVAKHGGDETIKILDFGIARARSLVENDLDHTRLGEVLGSPHYMSPEQATGAEELDYRTDLWSLGVVLYRALVGVLPFPGSDLTEVVGRLLSDPVPKATLLVPSLPPSVDGFFEKALSRDPEGRFSSAQEMAEAFAAALEQPLTSPVVVETGQHEWVRPRESGVPPGTLTFAARLLENTRASAGPIIRVGTAAGVLGIIILAGTAAVRHAGSASGAAVAPLVVDHPPIQIQPPVPDAVVLPSQPALSDSLAPAMAPPLPTGSASASAQVSASAALATAPVPEPPPTSTKADKAKQKTTAPSRSDAGPRRPGEKAPDWGY